MFLQRAMSECGAHARTTQYTLIKAHYSEKVVMQKTCCQTHSSNSVLQKEESEVAQSSTVWLVSVLLDL